MKSYFKALWAEPETRRTKLSRFTEYCGYTYMVAGFCIFFAPGLQVHLGLLPPFQGQEEGLYRLVGMGLGFIGYFYVFGGRSGSTTFGLSTVLDRLLVPFFGLFVFQTAEIHPMFLIPICVIDPIMAAIAYMLWRNEMKPARVLRE